MTPISKSLCWIGGLIALAAGNAFGLIADKNAQIMFMILPVVAITTLRGDSRCAFKRNAAQ